MSIENRGIFCSDRFRNTLLHLQNLHARLDEGRFETTNFIRHLGRSDAITHNFIQFITDDMNLAAGQEAYYALSAPAGGSLQVTLTPGANAQGNFHVELLDKWTHFYAARPYDARNFQILLPALVLKGGLLLGRVLDAERAQALATTKPRDVLMAELAGAFQAPIARMLGLLVAPVRSLGYALGAYRDKLAAGNGGAEPAPAAES